MHQLRLYNTLTKQVERFTPLDPPTVRLYTCGPTVYGFAHIGNLRTYIFADVLRRTLEYNGFTVRHVMNITDVGHLADEPDDTGEDKMEMSARRQKMSAQLLAKAYTEAFLHDIRQLHIELPQIIPKASEHVGEQITLIQRLERRGYTYRTSDGIYFDTSKFREYGRLANVQQQQLREGARVKKNPEKRNLTDFALWKFSPKDVKRQMEWTSPWGTGFPGWHIECSSMAMKYLGETFDMHAGGIDLIPIHHTNEIAQSEAATGKPFVQFWLHGEFLRFDQTRMGKSEGNILTLSEIQQRGFPALAYRYFTLNTHYRKPLTFSWEALDAAKHAYGALVERVQSMPPPRVGCAEFEERFHDAVNDDLNMPKALAVLWDLLKSDYPEPAKHQSLLQFDRVLGLGLNEIAPMEIPGDVQKFAAERERLRTQQQFAAADGLRQQIEERGFFVEDTANGPVVKRRT